MIQKSEEIIALTDNYDRIVGKTTKKESHSKGLLHRVVAVFVMRGEELLINRRTDNRLMDHSVGGHVKYDESYITAAVREAREEIGLTVVKDELEFIDYYFLEETPRSPNLKHWFTLFLAQVPAEFKPQPQEGEVVELFFANSDAIEKQMRKQPGRFSVGFLRTMNAYLKKFHPQKKPLPIR